MFILKKLINLFTKPIAYGMLIIMVILFVIIPDFYPHSPIGPYAFRQHANNKPLLDMAVNYSPQYAYSLIGDYGHNGRAYYVSQSLTLDLLIPLLMFLLIGSSLYFICRNNRLKLHVYQFMLIPFLGMLFDYLENIAVIAMISNYPKQIMYLPVIANAFSLAKGLFGLLGIVLTLALFVAVLIRKCFIRMKNREEKLL